MSNNSDTLKKVMEEIKAIVEDLRELVYSAPSQWLFDSIGSAVAMEQIGEAVGKIESKVQIVQQYCDEEYREATDTLLRVMWTGFETKNYAAILQAAKQLTSINIDFSNEPFRPRQENLH
ncbi:MAG: hypothetical protein ACE5J2_05995 [Nitrososphaerales archaeon]